MSTLVSAIAAVTDTTDATAAASDTPTYLVTGGAGFIGSNFVLGLLASPARDIRVVNVDALTYAGNLANLAALKDDPRHLFVQADICDAEAMNTLFATHQPRYVVNFAAESHVDRSIEEPGVFIQTNVGGTLTLLEAARRTWELPASQSTSPDASLSPTTSTAYRPGVRFCQVSTDEVYGSLGPEGFFTEDTPLDPHSPYSASKAAADLLVQSFFATYQLPVNITRCSNNYGPFQFPEKLIPLMLNNALPRRDLLLRQLLDANSIQGVSLSHPQTHVVPPWMGPGRKAVAVSHTAKAVPSTFQRQPGTPSDLAGPLHRQAIPYVRNCETGIESGDESKSPCRVHTGSTVPTAPEFPDHLAAFVAGRELPKPAAYGPAKPARGTACGTRSEARATSAASTPGRGRSRGLPCWHPSPMPFEGLTVTVG
jgi:dTDP-glucose 4,6-dehydratase